MTETTRSQLLKVKEEEMKFVPKQLSHLSLEQVQELITRYYNGERVKSINKIIVYSTFAIQIGEVYPYESPIDPQKLGIKPPQSFRYWNWGGGAK